MEVRIIGSFYVVQKEYTRESQVEFLASLVAIGRMSMRESAMVPGHK